MLHHPASSRRLSRSNILTTTVAALIAQAMLTSHVGAQLEIGGFNGSTTQNFDTLASSGTANAWSNDTTLDGWYLFTGAGTAISAYNAADGTSSAGSFYSFGPAAGSDRALGGVASGGGYFGSPASGAIAGFIAFAATNASTGTINSFTLGFEGEQWRNGGNTSAQSMVLEYGFGSTFSAVSTWVKPGGFFDWTSPVVGSTAGGVDGNTAGLVAGRGGSIAGLTWTPGDTLWIRWTENNDAGNDHGLAIDNFSLTWTGVDGGGGGTPNFWDLNGSASGLGGLGPGLWDSGTTNWTNNASGTGTVKAYDPNQPVTFGGTAGEVTIVAAGITAQKSITFDTGSYQIKGPGSLTLGSQSSITVTNVDDVATIAAPIAGTNGVVKAGGGILSLTGTNTFSGTTAVNAGVLQIVSGTQLGSSSVALNTGTLRSTGSITLAAGAGLSGSGSLEVGGPGIVTVPGTTALTALTLINPTELNMNGPGNTFGNLTTLGIAGPVTLNGDFGVGTTNRIWTIVNSDAAVDLTVNGKITGGTGRIQITGDPGAVIRLNGDSSTFTGGFRLNAGAPTIVLGSANALGTGDLFFNGGGLIFATALTIPNTLSIGGGVGISGSEATVNGSISFFTGSGSSSKTLTLPGVLNVVGQFGTTTSSTSGGFTLLGGGTMNLLNTVNEHKDVTYITDGTLNLSGSLAGAVGVGDPSDITSGTFAVSPGAITTTNIGGLGMFENSTLRLELNSTLGTADSLVLSSMGELLLGTGIGTLQLTDLGSGTLPLGTSFTLIDGGIPLSSDQFFKSLPDLATFTIGANRFSIDYNAGGDGADVVLTTVPEPGAALLATLSGALLSLNRRRRR